MRWEIVLQLRKGRWHRCGICKMGSDAKVSGDVIKVMRKWYKLQIIREWMQRKWLIIRFLGSSDGLAPFGVKMRIFIPRMWSHVWIWGAATWYSAVVVKDWTRVAAWLVVCMIISYVLAFSRTWARLWELQHDFDGCNASITTVLVHGTWPARLSRTTGCCVVWTDL